MCFYLLTSLRHNDVIRFWSQNHRWSLDDEARQMPSLMLLQILGRMQKLTHNDAWMLALTGGRPSPYLRICSPLQGCHKCMIHHHERELNYRSMPASVLQSQAFCRLNNYIKVLCSPVAAPLHLGCTDTVSWTRNSWLVEEQMPIFSIVKLFFRFSLELN